MRCRSNALAFGPMVLVFTSITCCAVGSVTLADDPTAPTEVGVSATADQPDESISATPRRSCNRTPLPVPPEPPPLTPQQLASLETVQQWADLVASAEPDQSDPALFAEVMMVYPGWNVDSAEDLSDGWGNLEAAHLVWVREDDDGTFVLGELVYDNASSRPCRTGFLCLRADVNEGVIDSLNQEALEGTIDEGTVVDSDYPYVDGRWIAAEDETSFGDTVQARLIVLCDAAIPRPNDGPAPVGYIIEGTAVATSAGGDEACQAQPSGVLPAGLLEGAPVTVRDASSGDVIGTGTVTSTNFVQHTESTELPPPWTCTFNVTARLSSRPDSITIQVGEQPPWGPVSLDDGGFTVPVPRTGPESTLPVVESTVVPAD